MCGIAGVVFASHSLTFDPTESLRKVADALATRGPDAEGFARLSGGAFAHRRLSILDLNTRSDQPMRSGDGRYTIVFNGEIYNYQQLRRDLESKGHRFGTTGDTEVLLAMYAEYGSQMLPMLRGMYAFGIWEEQTQQLFLARDPLGIKPLYYTSVEGCLYFASQVKALLRIPGVDTVEQPAGHVGFFVWGSVPEPYTLYRGIHCLPSGTWMRVTSGEASQPRCFLASPTEQYAAIDPAEIPRTEAEMNARLHDALSESIRMHEISDVPVAIFLSAGIDSGMIASLAAENRQNCESLTLGFDMMRGTSGDEVALARQVADSFEMPNRAHYVDRQLFFDHRERLLQQMDQPTIDGINTYFISWLARQNGFKVALSGLGGDELFGGYPSFRQIPHAVHTFGPLSRIPGLGTAWHVVTAPLIRRFSSPKYASIFEYSGSWGGAYLLRRGLFLPWELPEVLDSDLVREGWRDLASIPRMNAMVDPLPAIPGAPEAQRDFLRVSILEMSWYMRSQLLRDADWAGMAHSLEIRVPFVDVFLLRQLAPLLVSQFSPRKPGIVRALRKPLPDAVVHRPKTGFVVPIREWMQEKPLRGLRHWASFVYEAHRAQPGG